VGGPNADLRRVWYLCVAAAFGRYRNRVGATGAVEYQIECAWDVTGKSTMVTLGYTLSGISGNVGRELAVSDAGIAALTTFGGSLVSADGLGRLRLTQIADLHEILDLREEAARKVRSERDREARTRRFRRP
jgi:hypothetical protein